MKRQDKNPGFTSEKVALLQCKLVGNVVAHLYLSDVAVMNE